MHADDVEEGFAVDVVAGARAAFAIDGGGERRGGGEGRACFGDAGGLQIRLAAHDGGEGSGEVAAGVGVVGQAEGHQQRAEVGVAEAERPVVVGVSGDGFGGVAGVIDEDLHGGDHDVDGGTVGGDVEGARRA